VPSAVNSLVSLSLGSFIRDLLASAVGLGSRTEALDGGLKHVYYRWAISERLLRSARDREFESIFLQRRVSCEPEGDIVGSSGPGASGPARLARRLVSGNQTFSRSGLVGKGKETPAATYGGDAASSDASERRVPCRPLEKTEELDALVLSQRTLIARGTGSSNPSPSSGETFSVVNCGRCRPKAGRARRVQAPTKAGRTRRAATVGPRTAAAQWMARPLRKEEVSKSD
jgi:hypothetical protein